MKALKGYLMLGHGDFADHLMESLGYNLICQKHDKDLTLLFYSPSLIRPAHSLYLHHLTTNLESAIRSSNAQNDSAEVLRRLDARMLDHTDGEIGWEVFTLVYKVDAPIDTILDPDAMIQYQRLFNHLWKMKRVNSEVNGGWTRLSQARKQFGGSLPGKSANDTRLPAPEFLILCRVHAHLARNWRYYGFNEPFRPPVTVILPARSYCMPVENAYGFCSQERGGLGCFY